MKAVWNNTVIAEANNDELIKIEGNWYFPPHALRQEYFRPSEMHTTCFWKGEASYYDIHVGDSVNDAGAWYYAEPMDGSVERVKKDFSDYVAFWHGVVIQD